MTTVDLADVDCPAGVMDRLLWLDAQHILRRHVGHNAQGLCAWCGREWPCPPRRLAERAELASFQPWREAWNSRADYIGPRVATSMRVETAGRSRRNGRTYGRARPADD